MDRLSMDLNGMKESMKTLIEMKRDFEDVRMIATDAHECAGNNKSEIALLREDVKALEKRVETLETEKAKTNKSLTKAHDDYVKLDTYIRRDNLVFQNVQQAPNENCENVIRNIFRRMKVDNVESIQFVRVHRLTGRKKTPLPIICRFEHFADRVKVWNSRFNLKQTNIQVQEDFHPDILARRQVLFPIMMEAKKQQMKSTLSVDKLIIDGTSYTIDDLGKLPDTLSSIALGMKESPDAVAFFTKRCPLSNFYHSPFVGDDGTRYHSTEQFLQFKKAEFAGDQETATKIFNAQDPLTCKNLAKSIKNVNEQAWQNVACGIMKSALRKKFESNQSCKETLLKTGLRRLGEATNKDPFWGTGIALGDKLATNCGAWQGANNMGKLLEEVRLELQ